MNFTCFVTSAYDTMSICAKKNMGSSFKPFACGKGEFYILYPDLRLFPTRFFCYYWMKVQMFDALLELLKPSLERKISNFRTPISAEQQLVLTLR